MCRTHIFMWCTLATLLRGTLSRSVPIALPLVRSVESATVAAAQSERPGYAPYQQQGGGDQFSADWFVERFKVLLNGGKFFFTEAVDAQRVRFRRLESRYGGKNKQTRLKLNIGEQMRASRAENDFLKGTLLLGLQFGFKRNMLTWVYWFPRQLLPSTFFTERNDIDRFHRRFQQRIKGASNMLVKLEDAICSDNTRQRDLYRPYADFAAEILAAPSPYEALACLGKSVPSSAIEMDSKREKPTDKQKAKNKAKRLSSLPIKNAPTTDVKVQREKGTKRVKKGEKLPPPLKGLPPILVKGYAQSACDLPLGLASWAPAFVIRALVSGTLRDLSRSDAILRAAQESGEDLEALLTRRDLLELAAARGFGHGGASDKALVDDLKAWLATVYERESKPSTSFMARGEEPGDMTIGVDSVKTLCGDLVMGEGWAEGGERRRAVLVSLNVVESLRRHPGASPHRALFAGGEVAGLPFINHPLDDTYKSPLQFTLDGSHAGSSAVNIGLAPPVERRASTTTKGSFCCRKMMLLSSLAFTSGIAMAQTPLGVKLVSSVKLSGLGIDKKPGYNEKRVEIFGDVDEKVFADAEGEPTQSTLLSGSDM